MSWMNDDESISEKDGVITYVVFADEIIFEELLLLSTRHDTHDIIIGLCEPTPYPPTLMKVVVKDE